MPFPRDVTVLKKKQKGRKGSGREGDCLIDLRLLISYTLSPILEQNRQSQRTNSQLHFTALTLKGVNIYPPACMLFGFAIPFFSVALMSYLQKII